jgi:pyruvyl transferase EpsO
VRPAPATADVVWLAQHELERHHPVPPDAADVPVLDWVAAQPGEPPWPPGARLAHEVNARLRRVATADGRAARLVTDLGWRPLAATFEPLARAWVARGAAMAATGRVVVTDRAHGHVLSLLLGIPSVVLDNVNHKVAGIVEASTAESPLTHPVGDAREALEVARRLAAEVAG